VLLLITARPEFKPPWPGYAHVTTIPLTRLDQREGAALVERVTRGKSLPDDLMEQILARTDGVPLFIEELTKTVLESGRLREEAERYVLTEPLPPLAIPSTLHDSLMARLDRLASARDVVQTGAALGREFSYELLQAVAGMPDAQLHEALSQLVRSELMFCRGVPPQAVYTFKHVLVQDAAYGSLLRSRRQQLHARIATTLERQFPDIVAMQPERLAQHCTEAGLGHKAIPYWLEAGQQAIAGSAMTEALALLRKGLALVSGLPDSAARQEHELDLRIACGRALMVAKGHASREADQAFARARQLCEQLNRPAKLVSVLFGQFVIRF
jgi:predicted ATPase